MTYSHQLLEMSPESPVILENRYFLTRAGRILWRHDAPFSRLALRFAAHRRRE
jgi:hypothetical protein